MALASMIAAACGAIAGPSTPAPSRVMAAGARRLHAGIVTPAPSGSRLGNRVTALRWARRLRELGCRVTLEQNYQGGRRDLLVALHARRSFESMHAFQAACPGAPVVVALTGTDLYGDLETSEEAQTALRLASRLVVLQPDARTVLPPEAWPKVRVIYQSAEPPPPQQRSRTAFEVCVLGHLRPVKDPFRAAEAAHLLPPESRIRIIQAGAALDPEMETRARAETASNPRYRWLGELPRWKARRLLARCRLLVLSSRMEGGANVVSEALVSGVPVLASHISGSIGLLGPDYSGYFPVAGTQALAELLSRAENDEGYYVSLEEQCRRQAPLFRPQIERDAWAGLLNELLGERFGGVGHSTAGTEAGATGDGAGTGAGWP